MDHQKMWENNLKKKSKVDNAIAVAGLKVALLIGEKNDFKNYRIMGVTCL